MVVRFYPMLWIVSYIAGIVCEQIKIRQWVVRSINSMITEICHLVFIYQMFTHSSSVYFDYIDND